MTSPEKPMLALPKLVIFDWDGTLVDSIESIVTGFREAYSRQSSPCPAPEELKKTIGLPLGTAFERLSPELPSATMVEHYRDYWFDPERPTSPWAEGATQILDWLAAQNILSAIATGKSRRGVEHELDLLDARSRFITLRSADDAQAKPHPDMLCQILQELNLEPNDALVIGDSPLDLQMARAASVSAYGVLGGVGNANDLWQEQPLAVLPTIGELRKALTLLENA